MKKVNIVIGRFQPVTKGHYSCVEAAWKEKGIPTVICMIDVPENKVDERHPFPTTMLVDLYRDLFKKDPKIADVVMVKNADIVKIAEELKKEGYEIASWTCGTDRIDSYTKMSDKYKDQAGLADDFEMIEVKRGDEDISATKVRQALLDDDRTTFLKMVPTVSLSSRLKHDLFTELQEQIRKVVKS